MPRLAYALHVKNDGKVPTINIKKIFFLWTALKFGPAWLIVMLCAQNGLRDGTPPEVDDADAFSKSNNVFPHEIGDDESRNILKPRSGGFPAGLLDRAFDARDRTHRNPKARFNGLTSGVCGRNAKAANSKHAGNGLLVSAPG